MSVGNSHGMIVPEGRVPDLELFIAIVDDLQSEREHIRADLERIFRNDAEYELRCICFESAEAFLSASPEVQIVFLDICMEGMNGIELARRLRSLNDRLLIIFLSTSSEYAFDAFPIHPFDYLIKPYPYARLEHVVKEAVRILNLGDRKISIRVARSVLNIPVGSIVSAVSQGHRVVIALAGAEPIQSIMTFSEAEGLLATEERFLPVNRGILINMDYARALTGDTLTMLDGSVFALRTKNRSQIISRFSHYQLSRLKGGLQ